MLSDYDKYAKTKPVVVIPARAAPVYKALITEDESRDVIEADKKSIYKVHEYNSIINPANANLRHSPGTTDYHKNVQVLAFIPKNSDGSYDLSKIVFQPDQSTVPSRNIIEMSKNDDGSFGYKLRRGAAFGGAIPASDSSFSKTEVLNAQGRKYLSKYQDVSTGPDSDKLLSLSDSFGIDYTKTYQNGKTQDFRVVPLTADLTDNINGNGFALTNFSQSSLHTGRINKGIVTRSLNAGMEAEVAKQVICDNAVTVLKSRSVANIVLNRTRKTFDSSYMPVTSNDIDMSLVLPIDNDYMNDYTLGFSDKIQDALVARKYFTAKDSLYNIKYDGDFYKTEQGDKKLPIITDISAPADLRKFFNDNVAVICSGKSDSKSDNKQVISKKFSELSVNETVNQSDKQSDFDFE